MNKDSRKTNSHRQEIQSKIGKNISTPPPSEASREEMNNIDFAHEWYESNREKRTFENVYEALVKYASRFPTANVTQGEVERIKEELELEIEAHIDLAGDYLKLKKENINLRTELTQLRSTIDDQAKEIERLKNMDSMKWGVGKKVKIIACTTGHEFEIGQIVTINDYPEEGEEGHWPCLNEEGDEFWYVKENEAELI